MPVSDNSDLILVSIGADATFVRSPELVIAYSLTDNASHDLYTPSEIESKDAPYIRTLKDENITFGISGYVC